jgi:Fur family ferric uptake transcriptional regulator
VSIQASTQSDSWAERASERLADAGYRRGGARAQILGLLDEQVCALSAVEIQEALERREQRVSRASVYRILEELEQVGMVGRLEIGHGMVRYEPVRHGHGHHHHLVCDHCGQLTPFSDEGLERAIKRLSERVPLRVSEHEVVLHGVCGSCQQ